MTTQEFRLPDLGEGLTDADLVEWKVAVGDAVVLNQVIAEVETAKALVELPSPVAGTVAELIAKPGETVLVGAPLLTFETDEKMLVGTGPKKEESTRRRPDAKPAARKLARELGVDLSAVQTDRPITVEDVRMPVVGVRRATAEAMTASANIPYVTEFLTVDCTASADLIAHLRASPHYEGVRVTALGIISRLCCLLMPEHPAINSRWADDEIIQYTTTHLGIATASPRGLLVPVIRDAAKFRLREMCQAIETVTSVARSGQAQPSDLRGSTFTITNIGVFGVDTGTPMLNPGEAAILALGKVAKRPWVVDDQVVPRWVTTLALSFDHRLVDGEQGSKFLAALGDALSDPLPLLG
ncbi:dihydrolipoamide acetyltransferase family protein [Smaragdicoccus niigatensis]|uniref:dihydrolipoamide acetyltransferase family protein n=1 Tax=Smaragdicoccus niigatensis TaxID=359359 RepID=UPI000365DE97|nr:dihydrolipoamide acetyltransferase family protein [Smaragdicoccus niigatensis]